MIIKFIVNGKTFTTLCKTVKTSNSFRVEMTDIYGYRAIAIVDNIERTIKIISVNGTACSISQKFADYGKTEKGFKMNLMNFLICYIRHNMNSFWTLNDETILFHLSKAVEIERVTSSTSEQKDEETSSISEQKDETIIKKIKRDYKPDMTGYVSDVKFFNEKGEEINLTDEQKKKLTFVKTTKNCFWYEEHIYTLSDDEKSDEETSSLSSQIDEVSEIESRAISFTSSLSIYSEKGVAMKGFVDRIEVDLDFNTIQKFNHHFFIHDLGYIRYDEKKWSFSSDEINLTKEILHKLIELYDEGITPDKIWLKGKTFTPIEFIDFLYMKESYFILTHWHIYEKGFFHIYHGYASKKLLIDTNKSNVFNKWKIIAPISKSAFLEGVKWICGDPSPEEKCYTRAIALTPNGIIKLTATHSVMGYNYFDENGKIFSGSHFRRKALTDKEKLFADEHGELSSFCKIILSSKDRV